MSNPIERALDLRDHLHDLNPQCHAIAAAWGFRSAVQVDIEVRIVDGKAAASRLIFTRFDRCPAVEDAERMKRADLALRHIEAARDTGALDDAMRAAFAHRMRHPPKPGLVIPSWGFGTRTGRTASATSNIEEVDHVRDE